MYIKVTGLYIGQGMSNLVEVYENKADATAANPVFKGLVLIDCGTFGKDGKPAHAPNEPDRPIALNYIERKIRQNNGALSALVLSHLDQDHINKIIRLTGERQDGPLQRIGTVLIGGTAKKFNAKKNVFTGGAGVAGLSSIARKMAVALKKICNNIRIFSVIDGYVQKDCNFLDFKGTTGNQDELRFRILANRSLPALKNGDDLYINGNSAVIVAEYIHPQGGHFAFLFTGDATDDTFAYMNKRLDKFSAKYTFLNAAKKVLMLPHHGAVRTACPDGKMTNRDTLADQLAQATTFADTVAATHVFASAHYNAKRFSHPNMDVFDIFSAHADAAANHENFGFRVRLDGGGVPIPAPAGGFPSYGLFTIDSTKAAYTAHTIITRTQPRPPDPPFSKPLVSYTSAKGGAFRITNLPAADHQFYSLISEVENGVFNSVISQIL
ncbi:hypothetical protein NIA71_04635 [Ihubacter massiliensis]|uniref:Metallo-beta-lactamase domain-containing protein n=1 Tax=Hominibacterium faecale TaxID=2839743 RepID=A0A9J6QU32_9FIRM|nr:MULTISPECIES: hypothetical protein [Eubacteriales Family XIII. Incertae Sedis]MCO7121237.1 hypothetical protein [Ihubacter massiliensis]MCU7378223.1 hypothetical protein [Hominibacterium faecale]